MKIKMNQFHSITSEMSRRRKIVDDIESVRRWMFLVGNISSWVHENSYTHTHTHMLMMCCTRMAWFGREKSKNSKTWNVRSQFLCDNNKNIDSDKNKNESKFLAKNVCNFVHRICKYMVQTEKWKAFCFI